MPPTSMIVSAEDQARVDQFAEFLRIAGPPDGRARERLIEAGREDLIAWALGQTTRSQPSPPTKGTP